MKYLIGDIPNEWLEEEKERKSKYVTHLEKIMLENEDDIWSTQE